MDNTQIVEVIRKEAKENKVADAVFHMWATRDRARGTVTVGGLEQRMKAEGFHFDKADYAKFLRFLSALNFGKLDESSGKVRGLKDVKIKLQSIGQAAIGTKQTLDGWRARNRYKHLVPETKVATATATPTAKPAKAAPVFLAVQLKDKLVSIPIPGDLEDAEVAALVHRLRRD